MDNPTCHDGSPIIEVIDALPDGVQNPAEVDMAYLPATLYGELRQLREACRMLVSAAANLLPCLDYGKPWTAENRLRLLDALSVGRVALDR